MICSDNFVNAVPSVDQLQVDWRNWWLGSAGLIFFGGREIFTVTKARYFDSSGSEKVGQDAAKANVGACCWLRNVVIPWSLSFCCAYDWLCKVPRVLK
jgi:hypothetical protein